MEALERQKTETRSTRSTRRKSAFRKSSFESMLLPFSVCSVFQSFRFRIIAVWGGGIAR